MEQCASQRVTGRPETSREKRLVGPKSKVSNIKWEEGYEVIESQADDHQGEKESKIEKREKPGEAFDSSS